MNLLNMSYTQVPFAVVMPAIPQLVTTIIYGLGASAFIVYAFILCHRHKSSLPILIVLGALLSIYLEPVVDILGNALHPQIGQYNLITTNGHPVPWAVLLGYVWYFAGVPLVCYDHFVKRKLTASFVWKLFFSIAICAALVEQIPLYFGVWIYYGVQPLKVGFIPLWWVFANTTAVILVFVILYALYPALKGWRQWLVVGLIPSAAFMGHSAAGWPMYNALGLQTEVASSLLLILASFAVIALSMMTVWALLVICGITNQSKES